MAFKLTSAQVRELHARQQELRLDREQIEQEFGLLRGALATLPAPLNALIRAHNERLSAARAFAEGIAEEHRDALDERSDAWKSSDRGQAAEAFVEEWERIELDDVDEVELLLPDKPEWNEGLNGPEEAD